MPPKKRQAAADTLPTGATKRKKVSIGGTSIIGDSETHASGRPKRASIGEPTYSIAATKNKSSTTTNSEDAQSTGKTPTETPKRGRGRPRKDEAATTLKKSPSKPVGKPRRSGRSKFTHVQIPSPAKTTGQAQDKVTECPKSPTAPAPKSRGRPKKQPAKETLTASRTDKSKGKAKSPEAGAETAHVNGEDDEEPDEPEELTANESDWDAVEDDDGKQYWLMKAEPESRIEKGIDVKFSIDDLRNAKKPEGWDGVRNPAARNNMRAMKKGDLAFFYHSSCKVPGVVGIMEIVQEHSVDESAFDPASPYYDPKSSRDNPKWELVHVRFVRKFDKLITLTQLKSFAQPGGALQNLQMLKQTRLSVSIVKPEEWKFILSLEEYGDAKPTLIRAEARGAVQGQVVKVQEEVVREVNGEITNRLKQKEENVGAVKPELTAKSAVMEGTQMEEQELMTTTARRLVEQAPMRLANSRPRVQHYEMTY